jgi:transcriptional regulator with XRE-family HTH domain
MITLTDHLLSTGETQTSFAKRIDVHQGTISKLCAGKAPSLGLALKIERETGGAVPVAAWASSLNTSHGDAPADRQDQAPVQGAAE